MRKAGERVRITAQLIDGATGDHVWAERYDRDLTDIFAIQDEISKAIVDALKVKLLPRKRRRSSSAGPRTPTPTSSISWRGNIGSPAITANRGASELVMRICAARWRSIPNYARAWALMALAQCQLAFHFRHGDGRRLGGCCTPRSSIDPSVAEAYCVRAGTG